MVCSRPIVLKHNVVCRLAADSLPVVIGSHWHDGIAASCTDLGGLDQSGGRAGHMGRIKGRADVGGYQTVSVFVYIASRTIKVVRSLRIQKFCEVHWQQSCCE